MVEIKTYIENPTDYATGVALFKKYTPNAFIERILDKGDSPLNRKYIFSALSEFIYTQNEQKTTKQAPDTISQGREANSRTGNTRQFGNELRHGKQIVKNSNRLHHHPDHSGVSADLFGSVKIQRQKAYAHRGHLHGRLHGATTNEERLQLAAEILKLQKKIDAINEDFRKVEANEAPTKALLHYIPAEQYKKYKSCADLLKRYESDLRRAKTPEEKAKFERLVAKKTEELAQLKSIIS
jgi:hypothetical protein